VTGLARRGRSPQADKRTAPGYLCVGNDPIPSDDPSRQHIPHGQRVNSPPGPSQGSPDRPNRIQITPAMLLRLASTPAQGPAADVAAITGLGVSERCGDASGRETMGRSWIGPCQRRACRQYCARWCVFSCGFAVLGGVRVGRADNFLQVFGSDRRADVTQGQQMHACCLSMRGVSYGGRFG
jgi:hypothetical protein